MNFTTQETILIVDDDEELHQLLTYILKQDGYRLLHAHNGRQGLQLALINKPDLIILDMHMPIMNGLDVLEKLRIAESIIPVIFMTRFGSTDTAVKAFRLGVHHYLAKPFDLEDMRQTVANALQHTRLKRQQKELEHNLVAADAVRQTVVTLSHHINNQLMVVQTSLALMIERLHQETDPQLRQELKHLIVRSQKGSERIMVVLKVLQEINSVNPTEYFDSIQMLDITAAIEQELQNNPSCTASEVSDMQPV